MWIHWNTVNKVLDQMRGLFIPRMYATFTRLYTGEIVPPCFCDNEISISIIDGLYETYLDELNENVLVFYIFLDEDLQRGAEVGIQEDIVSIVLGVLSYFMMRGR